MLQIKLKNLIQNGYKRAVRTLKYADNFDWYKANQKQIIKDWNMPDYNW